MSQPPAMAETLHATTVALGPAGVLILGTSGAGKSGLALQMMALGCALVSDDQTCLRLVDGALEARAPAALRGQIEARGMGILAVDAQPSCILRVAVDLDQVETDRLPPNRQITLLGQTLPLLHSIESPTFAAALVQYLKGGRVA